jgi:hypothetical protein
MAALFRSMPLSLIQLISEQTMPNLLAVLRLRPARLVHLATPRTAARSGWIVEAARQAGLHPEVELITLSSMPSMPEAFNAVRQALHQTREAGHKPVVNFTGGTKLMSIAAYAAALHKDHRAMSLYVDTEDETFVDGRTAEGLATLLEDDFSFTPLHRTITVNTVAVANGRERVTGGRSWETLAPLAHHLFAHPLEEQATQEAVFGNNGFLPRGQAPAAPEHWLTLLERPLTLPVEVARLAAEAGLVRGGAEGLCRLPDTSRTELEALAASRARNEFVVDYDRRRMAATSALQRPLAFLTGTWWEVIVAEAAKRSGLFRDLRWSASAGVRGGADLEEDILALDGVQVVCISCKRGGERSRLIPHLEELNARARSVGGYYTRRFLAVYLPPKGRFGFNLRQRTFELGIRLLTPGDLANADSFARFSAGE